MSDPERLLKSADPQEARLLASALDEAPPEGLLERTLDVVAAIAPGAVAAGTGTAASAGAKGAAAAGAKAAGGGILGAVAIGAIAGAVTVGAYTFIMDPTTNEPNNAPQTSVLRGPTLPVAPPANASTSSPLPPPSAEPIQQKRTPAPQTITPAATARASELAAELSLLDDARDALRRGHPERALELLDRHAREIPRAQLGREAATLRAEAARAIDAGATNP